MSNGEHVTEVGRVPATGGRARQYATDAERARAWRERQKTRRSEAASTGEPSVGPVLAEATLAVLVDRLGEVGRAHEASVTDLVGRVEDAIGALTDPDMVADALAGARAEAARQVAEAEERAIRASQAKAAAETAVRNATAARAEAEEAANGAWERAENLEADIAGLRQTLDTVQAESAEQTRIHAEEVQALQAGHAEQLTKQQRQFDDSVAEIRQTARVAVDEANAGRDRAEGTAAELRAQLETARASLDGAVATARDQATAAYRETVKQLTARYEAEHEAFRAKAEAETTRAEVRADGALELAESRAGEITRLITQVNDLRADLRRARHDTER